MGKGRTSNRQKPHRVELHRNAPEDLAAPWAMLGCLFIFGALSHLLWPSQSGSVAGYLVPFAWMGGFTFLAVFSRGYTRPRGRQTHVHLFGTLQGAGLIPATLSISGLPVFFPWESAVFWVLAFPGGFAALSWNITRTRAVVGDGKDDHKGDAHELLEKLGLSAGTNFRTDNMIEGEIIVDHADGQTSKELQDGLVKLESMARMLPGSLQAIVGKHRGQSVMRKINPGSLDEPHMWPGPSHPGESCTLPIRTGMYIDGVPHTFVQMNHGATMGLTDAGKTFEAWYKVTELLTRTDIVVFWNDPIKGLQSAGPVLEGVDWPATDEQDAKAMLTGLLRAIPARTNELGRLGYTKWTPEVYVKHKIPKLFIQFEEAAWLIESGSLVKIAERARSAGIEFEMSLQRASHDRMSTAVRAMLGRRTCFGTMVQADADFVLSKQTLDAGADPSLWRASKKGAFYRESDDIPQDRWAIPARSFVLPPKADSPGEFDPSILTATIREWAHVRAELDPITAEALGPAYANRVRTVDEAVTRVGEHAKAKAAKRAKVPAMAGGPAWGSDEEEDEYEGFDDESDEDMVFTITDLDEDMGLPMTPPWSETEGVDPTEDIPDAPDSIDFSDPTPPLPTAVRNQKFAELLQEYLDRGVNRVMTREITKQWMQIPGAGARPWPPMRLERLEALGLAHRDVDDDRYWILEPGAGAAAMTDGDGPGVGVSP